MGSQIKHIYNKIAHIGILMNGSPIIGRQVEESSTIVNETPVRIVSPLSDKSEGRKAARMTLGKQKQVDWTITDLLLFRRTSDGSGLEDDMRHLVEYKGAYIDTMLEDNKLGFERHVMLTDVDVEIGVYQYPVNSGKFYNGVKATLEVHEIIP